MPSEFFNVEIFMELRYTVYGIDVICHVDTLYVHRQSAYLIGRNRTVSWAMVAVCELLDDLSCKIYKQYNVYTYPAC